MLFNRSSEKIDSIKEYAIKFVKGQLKYHELIALRDVSLTVEKGDVFGIVGLNGSGKSTLLKIIAGILKPTEGWVRVAGAIAPLIELGAGFDPELTARENIYLNGSVLGFSRKTMAARFDEIVDFAETEEFLDVPLKNYSSGMVARIAFSIATMTTPDILIVDEILSVGDFRFQQKCEARISGMMRDGTTVLVVSHSIEQIQRMCGRAIWLEKGEVRAAGGAAEVCEAYKNF
jgi:ABC-2 type transport system ATP-binding protein/lipopolysaccharide transport system ATP-binding protein